MTAYYNENDQKAAMWLRCLINEGLIPKGDVDERSIEEVKAEELRGYVQCHFFAGIGGWAEALRLAEWPDDVRVWTGSCPCQPLSNAGQRKGEMDERHLWPAFYSLIAQCRPATVLGEQVASNDGIEWLDGISLDLEELGYAVGAADLPAACVGAPHERQRLFWVADAQGVGCGADSLESKRGRRKRPTRQDDVDVHAGLAHADLPSEHGRSPGGEQSLRDERGRSDATVGVAQGNAQSAGPQEQWSEYRPSGEGCSGLVGLAMQVGVPVWNGPTIAVKCSDGPRRVSAEPGSFPLANGLPARMGRLRGYGNAIVPQVAAKFIKAYLQGASK